MSVLERWNRLPALNLTARTLSRPLLGGDGTLTSTEPARAPRESSGVRSKLPAGVLDASFASLATFVSGLVAVNVFEGCRSRDLCRLLLCVHVWPACCLPTHLRSRRNRRRLSTRCAPPRGPRGQLSARCVAVSGRSVTRVPGGTHDGSAWRRHSSRIALTATAFAATLLSPSQDHVRRTLHIADKSWQAAGMSFTQFLVTLVATGVMLASRCVRRCGFRLVRSPLPTSLSRSTWGLVLVAKDRRPRTKSDTRISFSELVAQGRWLLAASCAPAAAAFVTANIIIYLARQGSDGIRRSCAYRCPADCCSGGRPHLPASSACHGGRARSGPGRVDPCRADLHHDRGPGRSGVHPPGRRSVVLESHAIPRRLRPTKYPAW